MENRIRKHVLIISYLLIQKLLIKNEKKKKNVCVADLVSSGPESID